MTKDNETGLKERGGIEMSIYSASIHYNNNYNLVYSDTTKKKHYDNSYSAPFACRSFALNYLPARVCCSSLSVNNERTNRLVHESSPDINSIKSWNKVSLFFSKKPL